MYIYPERLILWSPSRYYAVRTLYLDDRPKFENCTLHADAVNTYAVCILLHLVVTAKRKCIFCCILQRDTAAVVSNAEPQCRRINFNVKICEARGVRKHIRLGAL